MKLRRRELIGSGLSLLAPIPGQSPLATLARAAAGSRLRWAPPDLDRPLVVSTGTGFYNSPRFAPDQDVIVALPRSPRAIGADIQINGGRHVRIVGGHTFGRLSWKEGCGSLYVQGLIIDLSQTPERDAIVASGANGYWPDIYLQNLLVTGVQGTHARTHADVFQPYGPIGRLRVHGVTADSNYQGFFIRPENPILGAEFSRVNMRFNRLGTPDGNTYLFWCRNLRESPARGDPLFPVHFGPDVYAEANAREPSRAAVFPAPQHHLVGRDGVTYASVAEADGTIRWPEASGITGEVRCGRPPGGDFILPEMVGAAYPSSGNGP